MHKKCIQKNGNQMYIVIKLVKSCIALIQNNLYHFRTKQRHTLPDSIPNILKKNLEWLKYILGKIN